MKLRVLLIIGVLVTGELAAQHSSREFERRSAMDLLERARTPSDRFAAQLNLGDLSFADGRPDEAREWWQRARNTASAERIRLYRNGQLSAWARLTSWEAVAAGLLGDHRRMRSMFARALEVLPGDSDIWSRHASAELSLGNAEQAVRLARIALAHAADPESDRTLLDRATVEFTLARALRGAGEHGEARITLERLAALLHGSASASIQSRVARAEAFSVSGTARGDLEAWTTLAVRTHTLLAELHESSGDLKAATAAARRALEVRSDHAPALALIARLKGNAIDWIEAFASDPLDRDLHHRYTAALRQGLQPLEPAGRSAGDLAILALNAMHRGQWSAAGDVIEQLAALHRTSEPLRALEAEWLVRQGRSDEAEIVASSIRTRRIRDSIPDGSAEIDASALVPPAGTLLSEVELHTIERLLRDPSTIASASAALNSRRFEIPATLDHPILEAGNTTAAAVITGAGRTLRFPAPVTFQGDWTASPEVILTFTILAADPNGLIIEAQGVRNP